jgi:hypothetical protein
MVLGPREYSSFKKLAEAIKDTKLEDSYISKKNIFS